MHRQDELCEILLRTGCLEFGTFKLSTGILSPYYVDLRLIPSDPQAFQNIIAMYRSVVEPAMIKHVQRLAGVPTGGVAYATVLAYELSKSLLHIRKDLKGHVYERRVEGLLQPGDNVLLLDDITTSGKNIVEAAEVIRAEGGVVGEAVVLLDRQQGGEEALRKTGIRLHAFTTMRRMADKLLSLGTIDERQHKEIVGQIIS